jgi:hypothetical protein
MEGDAAEVLATYTADVASLTATMDWSKYWDRIQHQLYIFGRQHSMLERFWAALPAGQRLLQDPDLRHFAASGSYQVKQQIEFIQSMPADRKELLLEAYREVADAIGALTITTHEVERLLPTVAQYESVIGHEPLTGDLAADAEHCIDFFAAPPNDFRMNPQAWKTAKDLVVRLRCSHREHGIDRRLACDPLFKLCLSDDKLRLMVSVAPRDRQDLDTEFSVQFQSLMFAQVHMLWAGFSQGMPQVLKGLLASQSMESWPPDGSPPWQPLPAPPIVAIAQTGPCVAGQYILQ